MMLGAVFVSLGLSSPADRVTVAAAIALIVGVLCFVASLLRLGFIANFLSRPILVGFMTGISLSILGGQIGRLTGVKIEADGLFRPIFELATKVGQIHWPRLALVRLFVARAADPGWLRSRPPGRRGAGDRAVGASSISGPWHQGRQG
jgi:MFS superfamily sulfate permease-like transporter